MDGVSSINARLDALAAAHSEARLATPDYRRQRRELIGEARRRAASGTGQHTLRRPAGAVGTLRAGRGAPARLAQPTPRVRRVWPWVLLAIVLLAGIAAGVCYTWPPPW